MAVIFGVPPVMALADPGDFLIRNTIRLSLVYWAIAWVLLLERSRSFRWFWTLAWAAYIVHVVMAFHYFHHWSHTSAVNHVQATSGFGPGIFVSYLFTALWTADVVWQWGAAESYYRGPKWLSVAWHAFMVFIIFNGAVVYESGPTRWISAIILTALFCLTLHRWRHRR